MVKRITNFFFGNTTEDRISILLNSVKEQSKELKNLKSEYDKVNGWYIDYSNMLNKLTEDMDAAVWSKNVKGEYIIANPIHCREFFGMDGSTDCLEYVRGKTDKELIKEIFKDRGFKNTYADICTLSDEYVRYCKNTTHFIEGGYINQDQVLFYVMKFPQFNEDGIFICTNGIAWNFTSKSATIINMLNRWIFDNKVNTVFCKDDVFCHALNKETQGECDIFKHICPNPEKLHCNQWCINK